MESHQNEKQFLILSEDFEREKKEISESSKTMMEKEQKYIGQQRQQISLVELEQESEQEKQSLLDDLSKLRNEL